MDNKSKKTVVAKVVNSNGYDTSNFIRVKMPSANPQTRSSSNPEKTKLNSRLAPTR